MATAIAHSEAGSARARGISPGRVVAVLLVVLALSAASVWVGLHWVAPNADWLYSLAWGDTLAGGHIPDVLHENAPLPHPLPVFVGVLLSPFAPATAFDLVSVLAAACWCLLGYGAFRLARVLAAPARAPGVPVAAGIVAAALVLSRGLIDFFSVRAMLDVPFVALVMIAVSLVLEAPRSRPLAPLALLAVAGLLRPDSWIIGFVYCAWLAYQGLRGRRLALCIGLALAPVAIWLAFAAVLTDDPLTPLTGNPESVGVVELGFQGGETATKFPSGLEAIDDAVDKIRSIAGDELALAALAAVLWVLVSPADSRRRTPRTARFALAGALVPALAVQSVILAQLGAPLSDRYVLAPAAIMIVLVVALIWTLPRPSQALLASGLLALLALTAPIGGGHPHLPTLPKVRYAISQSRIERHEQVDLYELASETPVKAATGQGCDDVLLAGRGGPHYMLAAKPLIAHVLGIPTDQVLIARHPANHEATAFLRIVSPRRALYLLEGLWSYSSPCLVGASK